MNREVLENFSIWAGARNIPVPEPKPIVTPMAIQAAQRDDERRASLVARQTQIREFLRANTGDVDAEVYDELDEIGAMLKELDAEIYEAQQSGRRW